jgi:hypothetical protein
MFTREREQKLGPNDRGALGARSSALLSFAVVERDAVVG